LGSNPFKSAASAAAKPKGRSEAEVGERTVMLPLTEATEDDWTALVDDLDKS
jgi:hypothetical protein